MYDREKLEMLESAYYENRYAEEMLSAGKIKEYMHYLKIMNQKLKCGMTATEIEAVQKRAEEAAKA
jgi:hypothetical protein